MEGDCLGGQEQIPAAVPVLGGRPDGMHRKQGRAVEVSPWGLPGPPLARLLQR
jgi:hypothetical protein